MFYSEKEEKIQATNICNERGDITSGSTATKRIIRKHYELYVNKFDNSDKKTSCLKYAYFQN